MLQIRVTGAKHGREARCLHFAPAPFAGLLKMTVIAHYFERAFAVNFLFQTPQGLFNRFAFFQFNFCQSIHILSGTLDAHGQAGRVSSVKHGRVLGSGAGVNLQSLRGHDLFASLRD